MKLVDVNLLLYVVNRNAPQHERVRRWWEEAIVREEAIGLAWIAVLGFLRLSTRPRIFSPPLTAEQAIGKLETWLALPNVNLVFETERQWTLLKQVLIDTGTAGNLTTDAHLAALAIANGATLVSCDADFGRYRQLRWENPLA